MPYFSYTQLNLGFIKIYTWGFFVGLAFVAGFFLILHYSQKENISQIDILNLSLLIFLGAIIGARVVYVLQYPFLSTKDFFMINTGGLAFHGGLLGAVITGWLYARKRKLNFWRLADIIAPAAALGIFIGRIGCFLINDHQGAATRLPWGILWPDGVIRHPVALYLSLNGLLLFFILCFFKKRIKQEGHLFLIFLTYYGVTRFLLDFTRVGDPRWGGLFVSQWLSLLILALVLARLVNKRQHMLK